MHFFQTITSNDNLTAI